MPKVKSGDIITFTTATLHSGRVKATRKVKAVKGKTIFVRMFGYSDYEIHPGWCGDKILKVKRNEK
jgi:hypothetical protein